LIGKKKLSDRAMQENDTGGRKDYRGRVRKGDLRSGLGEDSFTMEVLLGSDLKQEEDFRVDTWFELLDCAERNFMRLKRGGNLNEEKEAGGQPPVKRHLSDPVTDTHPDYEWSSLQGRSCVICRKTTGAPRQENRKSTPLRCTKCS